MGQKRPDPEWKKITDLLWERSGGYCEVSGRPLDYVTFDRHHRRLKGMGGTYRPLTDSPINLLALDPEVHNGAPWSVHQNSAWSRPRGYLLSSHLDDDALTGRAVLYRGKTWAFFTMDGGVVPMNAADQLKMWASLETHIGTQPPTRPRGSQYR